MRRRSPAARRGRCCRDELASRAVSSFGAFELVERVGQGGMAEVFRAHAFGASGFQKTVALKLLREEYVGEPSWERMFAEEARLQALVSHRCVVQADDSGVTEGRPWVRLEWVDGKDLATLLPLPAPLAHFVAAELCLALHAVHTAVDEEGRPLGLIHRDVSATNVLVSRAGEVKLGDFGIAKATLLKDQTRGGVRKGSWAYMSPEQVSGRPLTAASDVFSLATLTVELLTGARPFDGATPLETMDHIREAALQREVPDVLRACFAKAPEARPGVLALREALRVTAGDEVELSRLVK